MERWLQTWPSPSKSISCRGRGDKHPQLKVFDGVALQRANAEQRVACRCRWRGAEPRVAKPSVRFANLFSHGERVTTKRGLLSHPQHNLAPPAEDEAEAMFLLMPNEVGGGVSFPSKVKAPTFVSASPRPRHLAAAQQSRYQPEDRGKKAGQSALLDVMRANWRLCYQGGARRRHQCRVLSS